MNIDTLADRIARAAAEDHCQLGPSLTALVATAVLVGWQFRMVFATHKGEWSNVLDSPRKIRSGDPVMPHKDVHFEVRDVYAFFEEDHDANHPTR